MTGIANAHASRAPVLVLSGTPPRPQENRGALQDMSHIEFVRPITRYARTVREPDLVLQELDEAVARAFGQGGEPGPVVSGFPGRHATRRSASRRVQPRSILAEGAAAPSLPDPAAVARAVELLWAARGRSDQRPRRAGRRRRACCDCSTASARSTSTPARAAAS